MKEEARCALPPMPIAFHSSAAPDSGGRVSCCAQAYCEYAHSRVTAFRGDGQVRVWATGIS